MVIALFDISLINPKTSLVYCNTPDRTYTNVNFFFLLAKSLNKPLKDHFQRIKFKFGIVIFKEFQVVFTVSFFVGHAVLPTIYINLFKYRRGPIYKILKIYLISCF